MVVSLVGSMPPLVLEVVLTLLRLLKTLDDGSKLVRLSEAFEVKDGTGELVVLVPPGAAVVEFWKGPGQLVPIQLLTEALLAVRTLDVSVAGTMTTT
jgi:hypothetical protein